MTQSTCKHSCWSYRRRDSSHLNFLEHMLGRWCNQISRGLGWIQSTWEKKDGKLQLSYFRHLYNWNKCYIQLLHDTYLAMIKAIPIPSDLFSGSTNLMIQVIHVMPDIKENQMMRNKSETNVKKYFWHSTLHIFIWPLPLPPSPVPLMVSGIHAHLLYITAEELSVWLNSLHPA